MRVFPMKKPMCAVLEEYEEVLKMVSLEFSEDYGTWVALNMSGATGGLGTEAIDLRNWILCL